MVNPFRRSPPAHPRTLPAATSRWHRGQPLHLSHVSLTRRGVAILQDINLTFEPDRRYVIVGPSGAGKSTLIRLLNRLDDPSSGEIFLGDVPFSRIPIRETRNHVCLVFQSPRALPGSIWENLAYPYQVRGWRIPGDDVFSLALRDIGLPESWLDRDASALSGGERQRLAITVALGVDPEILVMDEPTSALDPESARRVMNSLTRRSSENELRTVIVTHHRGHAEELGDTGVLMERGRVIGVGPLAQILAVADGLSWRSPPQPGGSS